MLPVCRRPIAFFSRVSIPQPSGRILPLPAIQQGINPSSSRSHSEIFKNVLEKKPTTGHYPSEDLAKGIHYIADGYLRGASGFSKDHKKAVYYFEEAAFLGNWPAAKVYLSMLEHGWLSSVSIEKSKGPVLLRKFAEKGNLEALTKLAHFTAQGIGTSKNIEEAIFLLKTASLRDHVPAQTLLKTLKCTLTTSTP